MIGGRRAMMVGGSLGTAAQRGVGRGGPFGNNQASRAGWWPPRRTGWKCALRRPGNRAPCHRRSRSSRAFRCTGCAATFPPDARPGAERRGPPVLMVHPMMMSADMWDVTRDDGAGRHPAQGRRRLVGHRLRLTRQGRGRHGPQPRRPRRRASEAIDTVKQVTGRDVHLAGYSQGGMFAYQAAAYRRSKDLRASSRSGARSTLWQVCR
jgi:pimeloyl-ACP methyl ester carboxylesterase